MGEDDGLFILCLTDMDCIKRIKHTLWPNLTKTNTLNATAKEIVTLNTLYGLF